MGKSGIFCDKVDEKLFDGDINYENSVQLLNECRTWYMRIDLNKLYSIQYIIVYHGRS